MVRKIGNEDTAAGMLLRFWRLALDYWKTGILMPERIFQMEDFAPILECGLAETREEGIYAVGSGERFAWYTQRRGASSKGGQKSAAARKEKYGTAQPPRGSGPSPLGGTEKQPSTEANSNRDFENIEPKSNPLSLSHALSHTHTHDLFSKEEGAEPTKAPEPESAERSPTVIPFCSYPSPFSDPVITEFLIRAKIKRESAALWLKTYEDPEWLKLEFLKMISWLEANAHKRPKSNYARFIGSWLGRGWEWHRKHLPTQKERQKTWQEIVAEEKAKAKKDG